MAAPSKMAALPDEIVEEFLHRLPPLDPASLVRAAAVCKRWRRIVSDAGFRRRFREFHRAPPTIAAFHNSVDGAAYVARFRPFASSSFPPRAGRRGEAVLDCRHGRVLLRRMPAVGADLNLATVSVLDVWDPVTDDHREVPVPYVYPYKFNTIVLCAATGTCDHLHCHGGPFTVVLMATDLDSVFVYAYSSAAASWSEASSIQLGIRLKSRGMFRPSIVSSDAMIYFAFEQMVLKYDLAGHVVSMIDPPSSLHGHKGNLALVEAKDGGFGVADVEGYNIHIWSWQAAAGSNGVGQWVKDQVIKLDMVMPSIVATGGRSAKFGVVGFGEGTDVIFITSNAGIFVVWRNSGRVIKVGEKRPVMVPSFLNAIFSFQSFYIPALEPEPRVSLPPSQSTEVSTKRKRKGDTSASGKSVRSRSRCGSNKQTEKAATKTRGKKRAAVKEKPEKEKKLKHDPSLDGPAMGTRSKIACLLSCPSMSTRSKRRL